MHSRILTDYGTVTLVRALILRRVSFADFDALMTGNVQAVQVFGQPTAHCIRVFIFLNDAEKAEPFQFAKGPLSTAATRNIALTAPNLQPPPSNVSSTSSTLTWDRNCIAFATQLHKSSCGNSFSQADSFCKTPQILHRTGGLSS